MFCHYCWPSLSLHHCGLPREIAIGLFQTFVVHGLIGQHFAPNIRVAKSKIREKGLIVWVILQEVMQGHPVLLNRAPTLHRLALEAQAEACLLMFSHMNLLSPAIRDPIFVPTQDMLIRLYVLTSGNRRAYRPKRINLDSPLWLQWRLEQCIIALREAPIEVHYESLGTY
ncbi:hypothetical protein Gohar_003673 [Gossypium harknessii]|uniref:DNA-directed RNA polymerase n=1 Tax=Gossypium harknessii TaxID=34285 RepID=A0A7J9IF02_9ROSI|nr:hypothetical protein [Gossypium harknessii]